MINDLLVLSRTQHKNALVSEAMKANQLWNGVLEDAKFEAEQMGKTMDVPYPPGPWPLYGNPHALESALEALCVTRCAIRTHISVSFAVDIQGITVHVDDDGRRQPGRSRADFPSVLPHR